MGESEIVKGSKILATYLGWHYVPSNNLGEYKKAGWYSRHSPVYNLKVQGNYIGRHHTNLTFYNSFDSLFKVIDKLEKEDLKDYLYIWTNSEGDIGYNFQGVRVDRFNGVWDVSVELQLDPDIDISNHEKYKDLPEKEQLFWNLVDAVKWVNNLKLNSNGKNNSN